MKNTEHTIWQDEYLVLADWEDDIREEHPELENEDEIIGEMYRLNALQLDDERANLKNIVIPGGILHVADLGLWNGRFPAYRILESGKVSDCLSTNEDGSVAWYVDDEGEFRARLHHHDGTNYYHYRGIPEGTDEDTLDELSQLIISGGDFSDMLEKVTFRLGDLIGDVYGWGFHNRPECTKKEGGRAVC